MNKIIIVCSQVTSKLFKLKSLDTHCVLFGSSAHKYELKSPCSLYEVEKILSGYDLQLPQDYLEFITSVGSSGAGPGYGLNELGVKKLNKTEIPFPGVDVLLKKFTNQQWLEDRQTLLKHHSYKLEEKTNKNLNEFSTLELFEIFNSLNIDFEEFYFFYEKGYVSDPTLDYSNSDIEIDCKEYEKGYIPLFEEGC